MAEATVSEPGPKRVSANRTRAPRRFQPELEQQRPADHVYQRSSDAAAFPWHGGSGGPHLWTRKGGAGPLPVAEHTAGFEFQLQFAASRPESATGDAAASGPQHYPEPSRFRPLDRQSTADGGALWLVCPWHPDSDHEHCE